MTCRKQVCRIPKPIATSFLPAKKQAVENNFPLPVPKKLCKNQFANSLINLIRIICNCSTDTFAVFKFFKGFF